MELACAASPITTPIDPGPESIGIAMGVREISSFVLASELSAAVIRLLAVTMPHAVFATIKPPAMFSTGSEMPKKFSTKRPKKRNTTRIAITYSAVLSAVFRRSLAARSAVREKNKGTPPNGFTIGKSARKVATAAEGKLCKICRTAVAGSIARKAYQEFGEGVWRSHKLTYSSPALSPHD